MVKLTPQMRLCLFFVLLLPASLLGQDKQKAKVYRYDFGDAAVKPAQGYTRIHSGKLYSKQSSFGFVPSGKDRGVRHRQGCKDHRLASFVFDDGGTTFIHELPNGTYYVSLATGDALYPSATSVSLNGVSLSLRTQTRKGEFVRVDGAKVDVTNGRLRVEIGAWGQLCFLEIAPISSSTAKRLRDSEASRTLVTKFSPMPLAPRKTERHNQGKWICIGPWHFPQGWIWIYPTFSRDGKPNSGPIRHGWGLYLHLPADKRPFPLDHVAHTTLTEFEQRGTRVSKRAILKQRRIPLTFRRVFQTRPYHHHAFEALTELIKPFQRHLSQSKQVIYELSVRVTDGEGKTIRSHSIRFVNRPTYLISNIRLQRRGLDVGPLGTRSKVNIGDLTGDGQCDYLFCIGAGYKAAYNSQGRMLWQYDQQTEPLNYNSVASRVCDIDRDGRAEVVCLQQGQLRVLDGRNGKVKRAVPWPNLRGRPNAMEARIFLANLRGLGVRDIVVLDGYANSPAVKVIAFTDRLERLWEASGFFKNGGVGSHCLNVVDIDADGKDEIAFGTTMLDHNGKVLWRLPYKPFFNRGGGDSDHVDEAEVADVDGDGRLEILFASGTMLDALTGKPHFTQLANVTNGQWVRIDKVRNDLSGQQLLIADKWSAPQLFDIKGKKLQWPFPFASWDLLDWNGDGKTEIMGGGLICDRRGVVIGVCDPRWTMPQYADITGNGSEEAIPWCLDMHGKQIRVFSSAPVPKRRNRRLAIRRRHYNFRD